MPEMRVVLVKPAYRGSDSHRAPSLALGYLAASLKRTKGIDVSIIDCELSQLDPLELASHSLINAADLVGITVMTLHEDFLRDAVKSIKDQLEDKRPIIVAGGPHATGDPEGVLINTAVDFIFRGEGEKSLVSFCAQFIERKTKLNVRNRQNTSSRVKNVKTGDLLHILKNDDEISRIPGICFYKDREDKNCELKNSDISPEKCDILVKSSPAYLSEEELEELAYPAWELFDLNKYWSPHISDPAPMWGEKSLPIITSRGCPMKCRYCCRSLGELFRTRSPESVLKEMHYQKEFFGADEFHISDEAFNGNIKRAERILELIAASDLNIHLNATVGMFYHNLRSRTIRLLAEAGFYRLRLGIETPVERLLKDSGRKPLKKSRLNRVIQEANNYGMITSGLFLFGFPGEKAHETLRTALYARKLPLHTAFFSVLVPFPGTPLFREFNHKIKDLRTSVSMRQQTTRINLSDSPDYLFQALVILGRLLFWTSPPRLLRCVGMIKLLILLQKRRILDWYKNGINCTGN